MMNYYDVNARIDYILNLFRILIYLYRSVRGEKIVKCIAADFIYIGIEVYKCIWFRELFS